MIIIRDNVSIMESLLTEILSDLETDKKQNKNPINNKKEERKYMYLVLTQYFHLNGSEECSLGNNNTITKAHYERPHLQQVYTCGITLLMALVPYS